MELIVANTGSYPRIGDTPQLQLLRQARDRWERGETTAEALAAVESDVTAQIVREQIAAGVEIPTDGQVRWPDPFSYFTGNLNGVFLNGLRRFFDTNTYFRQPVVTGRISRKGPRFSADYRQATKAAGRPVKAVLPGPYTLAQSSMVQGGYRSLHALALAYAAVLAQEVAELASAGAAMVQIDEPGILKHPEDAAVLGEALVVLARGKGAARVSLATYFGDAAPIYDDLQDMPVEMLHFDLTSGPRVIRLIAERGSDKGISLGLIDARTTKLETPDAVFPVLEYVGRQLRGPAHLAPSAGLEYLPRGRARGKLEAMRRLRDAYAGKPR
jgi:5-methyltetrahydropteroyltriglutamate--homocysteine methyltransferase